MGGVQEGCRRVALVTGGSGLLGRQVVLALAARGWRVEAPTHSACDLAQADAVSELLERVHPDLIVNCAAIRSPDVCERGEASTVALNVALPQRLAAWGVPLIHLSTDYVFDGRNAPYETDAPRSPLNAYGRQKAVAEEAIEAYEHVVVLRVPILFGPTADWRTSAVTVLAANLLAAKGACVPMDDLAVRYPTFTSDVAEQIARLAPEVGRSLRGIFHYSGEEAMTKHLMALTIAPLIGCDAAQCLPDYRPPTVPRPYDCHLSVRRLQRSGHYVPPTPFLTALLKTLTVRE